MGEELLAILQHPGFCKALQDVGVDVLGVIDMTDFLFQDRNRLAGSRDAHISHKEMIDTVLQLRGTNQATVKDIVDMRRLLIREVNRLHEANQFVSNSTVPQ